MERIRVGDWVKTSQGRIGYVEALVEPSNCRIVFDVNNKGFYHKSYLEPCPFELKEEDIYVIQLLAVHTDDKDWFDALNNYMIERIISEAIEK